MVCPEGAGGGGLHPGGDCARVGPTREHPWRLVSVAAVIRVEG